ncbi:MAG: protein-disulfide reductase DsbD family protein [Inhella sp.]|jgi:thiol:disulfide interchange protein/DsbC/DsbD-like thiol-disulfide interchange protein|uniref:protein-disulfide reductase DsbD family protein n=1 Tax=Inhella sp. TaxID=1921806 RepID=UPI0022C5024E|nr:protein-disulfide reductase DsbD domain-containing protein [Inhella sp.]MCZ8234413.1 protein-disulfide reductase DsbD family protein [Inhella sp.]
MTFHAFTRWALALVLLGASALAPAQEQSAPVKSLQAAARLLAHAPEGVAPGKTLWLGLEIEHAPHWHTYWKNPGDSGLPTTLNWTLPGGLTAGDIQWPAPHKLPLGPMVNYGFEGKLLLPVAVSLPDPLPAGPLKIDLQAQWLVCKDVCIPEEGQFSITLPTGKPLTAHAAAFAQSRAAQPATVPGLSAKAQVAEQDGRQALVMQVPGLPADWRGQRVSYFAGEAGVIEHAAPAGQRWEGETLWLSVPLSPVRSESPAALSAVLRQGERAVALPVALAQGWTPGPAPAVTFDTPATAAAAKAQPEADGASAAAAGAGFGLALGLAFVGGLLLNLMPCVFPVLSLKAFSLVQDDAPHRRGGAIAYTLGVVISFVALAGLLLALRAGGEQIGWGFQLQTPWVVAAMAALFTLIALNLFGVFEVALALPGHVAGWRAERPWLDQAATGVLSVAIASPCTAPFMGAALGAALALPAWQALSVFASLGLGMAAPYALIAFVPALARLLPRPGAWMARVRTLLAFPMLATVLWLVWVLGQQTGIDGAVALLVLLLGMAYAVWAWTQGGWGWRVSAAVVLGAAGVWAAPSLHQPEGATVSAPSPQASGWQAWSPEAQAQTLAAGQPVFVDFTAAWCISCQYNKRNALADAAVLADFAQRGVVLMRADWTLRDATITAELRRLGRSGVPVYALYKPGATEPVLLPEILSADGVRSSLAATLNP